MPAPPCSSKRCVPQPPVTPSSHRRSPCAFSSTSTNATRHPLGANRLSALTEREEDIVRSVARGLTNAEIGEQLFISLSTVKSHVANIQSKLGVRNRVEIAGWAWETGRMS